VELYLHSRICLQGTVLNWLSTPTNLPICLNCWPRCFFRFCSYGLQNGKILWVVTDVSEEHVPQSSDMKYTLQQTTLCRNPEEHDLKYISSVEISWQRQETCDNPWQVVPFFHQVELERQVSGRATRICFVYSYLINDAVRRLSRLIMREQCWRMLLQLTSRYYSGSTWKGGANPTSSVRNVGISAVICTQGFSNTIHSSMTFSNTMWKRIIT
jgi:hypothetical protein